MAWTDGLIIMITGKCVLSLYNFEISEIEASVDISVSPINFADVCREHWHLVEWLWRAVQGLYIWVHGDNKNM